MGYSGYGYQYDIFFVSSIFCLLFSILFIIPLFTKNQYKIFEKYIGHKDLTNLESTVLTAIVLMVIPAFVFVPGFVISGMFISHDALEASIHKYDQTLKLVKENPEVEYLLIEAQKDGKLSNWEAWRIEFEKNKIDEINKRKEFQFEKRKNRDQFVQQGRLVK